MKKKSKIPKEDFFGKKRYLTRSEFRGRLRKASPFVPGFGRMITRKERVKIEKDVFGKKYGHYVEKKDYSRVLKELRKKKHRAKTSTERSEIKRKISFLRNLSGL